MSLQDLHTRLLSAKRHTVRVLLFCLGIAGHAISNGAQAAVLVVRPGPAFSTAVVVPIPRPVFWIAPPPPRTVTVPGPRQGWIWSPGYWRWTGHNYVWVDGAWLAARAGFTYVGPHWVSNGGGWVFVPGAWIP